MLIRDSPVQFSTPKMVDFLALTLNSSPSTITFERLKKKDKESKGELLDSF